VSQKRQLSSQKVINWAIVHVTAEQLCKTSKYDWNSSNAPIYCMLDSIAELENAIIIPQKLIDLALIYLPLACGFFSHFRQEIKIHLPWGNR
jgi:hypothetical protein